MSGDFLARLADRAFGAGEFVRPNSPPLFSMAPAATMTEVAEATEAKAPPAPQAPDVMPRAPAAEQPTPRLEPEPRPPIPADAHRHVPDPQVSRVAPAVDRSSPTAVSTPAESREPQHAMAPATRETSRTIPQTDNARPVAVSAVALAPAAQRVDVTRSVAPPKPRGSEAAMRLDREKSQRPEPPIHVSIGEIVVKLVEDRPVVSAPRSAPARPTLSLADYLRARDGEAR
jgi:hypothetical protein